MDIIWNFISPLLSQFGGWLIGAIGAAVGLWLMIRGAKKDQAQKDTIATQKEVIEAHETRRDVETTVRNADPDERERLRDKWRRD